MTILWSLLVFVWSKQLLSKHFLFSAHNCGIEDDNLLFATQNTLYTNLSSSRKRWFVSCILSSRWLYFFFEVRHFLNTQVFILLNFCIFNAMMPFLSEVFTLQKVHQFKNKKTFYSKWTHDRKISHFHCDDCAWHNNNIHCFHISFSIFLLHRKQGHDDRNFFYFHLHVK